MKRRWGQWIRGAGGDKALPYLGTCGNELGTEKAGVALQTEKMDVVAETALFPHNPFPLPPGDTALLNLPLSLSGGSGFLTEFWPMECGQHRTMKFRGRAVRGSFRRGCDSTLLPHYFLSRCIEKQDSFYAELLIVVISGLWVGNGNNLIFYFGTFPNCLNFFFAEKCFDIDEVKMQFKK